MITDLNKLKAFYYVYRRRNISAAAGDIFVTQSAASQTLKKLETELKCPLFRRAGKTLAPTQAAERLFAAISPFMQELERGLAAIGETREGPAGTLRIGAPVEFGSRRLIKICADFRRAHPSADFAITLGHPSQLLPALAKGELDLLFADIFHPEKTYSREFALFSIRPAAQEHLVLACSAEYSRKKLKNGISRDSLLQCDFLDYDRRSPAAGSWFAHHYGASAPMKEPALSAESVQALIAGIRSGMGLGVVPEYIIADDLKRGELVKIKTGRPDMVNRISLLRLKDGRASVLEKTFVANYFVYQISKK